MGLFSRSSKKDVKKRSGESSAPPPAYTPYQTSTGQNQSYYQGHPQNMQQPMQQQMPMPPQMAPQMMPQMPQMPPQQSGPSGRFSFPLPTANPNIPLADDPYSFLASFDTVLVIDDSGSMSGSRWRQTSAALSSIVGIVTYYDKDGVDIYFLNQRQLPSHTNVKSPEQVMSIFNSVAPRGATPTGQRLNAILKEYIARLKKNPNSTKPLNIIVITDGCPTDDVESVILQHAKKLDDIDADYSQVGLQFFQIGDDREATEALRELDDCLSDVRDMVDTIPWKGSLEGDRMLKVVLGAVNRRLDRKKG